MLAPLARSDLVRCTYFLSFVQHLNMFSTEYFYHSTQKKIWCDKFETIIVQKSNCFKLLGVRMSARNCCVLISSTYDYQVRRTDYIISRCISGTFVLLYRAARNNSSADKDARWNRFNIFRVNMHDYGAHNGTVNVQTAKFHTTDILQPSWP